MKDFDVFLAESYDAFTDVELHPRRLWSPTPPPPPPAHLAFMEAKEKQMKELLVKNRAFEERAKAAEEALKVTKETNAGLIQNLQQQITALQEQVNKSVVTGSSSGPTTDPEILPGPLPLPPSPPLPSPPPPPKSKEKVKAPATQPNVQPPAIDTSPSQPAPGLMNFRSLLSKSKGLQS